MKIFHHSISFSLPRFLLLLLLLLTNNGAIQVLGIDHYSRDDFPPGFVFGSGSSAYQVEGAAFEDGRTASIWDTYAHAGYFGGANGDVAIDVYHKYKGDVQLMADVGLEAYRFSISWSRLIPTGAGPVNPKGLEYYNNFINELISHGIQPHVSLFHIDHPQIIEDEYGGWVNRKSVTDFVSYADVCFREFGDRVLYWTTFNEPNIFVMSGYDSGSTPPVRCSSPFSSMNCTRGDSSIEPYIAGHNMLLAHASAAKLYRDKYKATQHGVIGLNVYNFAALPLTNSTEDVTATQRSNDFYMGWFINPLVFGDYPEVMKKNAGTRIPAFTELESELVKGSFDFLGVNHYTTVHVKDKSSKLETATRDLLADMATEETYDAGFTITSPLPVSEWGLQLVLEYFKHTYGNPPLYIHENGQRTKRNSSLVDKPRVEYLRAYIGSVLESIRNGSNTRGYFSWSFFDGLELLGGYEPAYGLYYVDLEDKDLTRYGKLSSHWYSNFLKGRDTSLDVVIQEFEKIKSSASQSHSSQ